MTASPSRGPLFPPSTPQGRVGLPGDLGPTCQCASGSRALWSMCWSHSGGPAFPCAAQSHAGSAAGVRLWFLGSNFPCPHAENTVMSLGTWDLSLSSGIGMHQGHQGLCQSHASFLPQPGSPGSRCSSSEPWAAPRPLRLARHRAQCCVGFYGEKTTRASVPGGGGGAEEAKQTRE